MQQRETLTLSVASDYLQRLESQQAQWHTPSNKATSTPSFPIVPATHMDQVLKSNMSLWGDNPIQTITDVIFAILY